MANPKGNSQNLIPFRPGQSGNPGGKPSGARNRLQADFLNALADHFSDHGKDAIDRACTKDPVGYIRAVASLLPKQFEIANPLDDFADADLQMLLGLVRAYRQTRLNSSEDTAANELAAQPLIAP
jgi:hypothetical protein